MAYYDPNAAIAQGIDPNTGLPYAQGYTGDIGGYGAGYQVGQQGITTTTVEQTSTQIDPVTGVAYTQNTLDTQDEYYW